LSDKTSLSLFEETVHGGLFGSFFNTKDEAAPSSSTDLFKDSSEMNFSSGTTTGPLSPLSSTKFDEPEPLTIDLRHPRWEDDD